jgi:hypothetical protein
VGGGRICTQSPRNLRTIILFEEKDNYNNYLEYMQPFFPVMCKLQKEGLTIDDVSYSFKQTVGADYVLLAEICGHAGHSCTQGCVFCPILKKDYGRLLNIGGRLQPMRAEPRTREMAALAAHRHLQQGLMSNAPSATRHSLIRLQSLQAKPLRTPKLTSRCMHDRSLAAPPSDSTSRPETQ